MANPTYDKFILPLLKLLGSRPDGIRSRDAYAALADEMQLSDADRADLLPSGIQPVYQNRIGWANDRLKRSRLSEAPSRGLWRITRKGRDLLDANPGGLNDEHLRNILETARSSKASVDEDPNVEPRPGPEPSNQSPEERIDDAMRELNESLSAELLDVIGKSDPIFFERLVLDVLVAMGYGASAASVQTTPTSGDAGIDGIITLDRLGLEKIYVQAKRWSNTVGRPQLQAFYGALAGRRATKGVFITTSDFSREAREFAASVSDSIVLVDGNTLTGFMIDFGVGVSIQRTVKIGRIDTDYFDDA